MRRRILIVDNDPYFIREWGAALKHAGYEVSTAGSHAEVDAFFKGRWVQAMVVDIRLLDDDDPRDRSGVTLAFDARYRTIPKIILTGFEDWQLSRETMGLDDPRYARMVYVLKREGLDSLLQELEKLFQNDRSGQAAEVGWGDTLNSFAVLGWLVPDPARASLEELSEELVELLQKLCRDSQRINVARIVVQRSGRVVLAVNSMSRQRTQSMLVILSNPTRLGKELEAYGSHMSHRPYDPHTPQLRNSVSTVHFAAACFEVPGADLEQFTTLDRFYRHAPADDVASRIENLFSHGLASSYEGSRSREEVSPSDLLRALSMEDADEPKPLPSLQQLQAMSEQLLRENLAFLDLDAGKILFRATPSEEPREIANFVPYMLSEQLKPVGPLLSGSSVGLLQADKVVTAGPDANWILNFEHLGPGPLLRDFVGLELVIRTALLREPDASARFQLEYLLSQSPSLDERPLLSGLTGEVEKAAKAICSVRQQAAAVLGSDSHNYLVALFYACGAELGSFQLKERYAPARLLSYLQLSFAAGLLCPRLSPLPVEAIRGLWIDSQSETVWVEGERKEPGRQEKSVLLLLYRHKGEVCKRNNILSDALGSKYADPAGSEGGRLDTIMSRLRKQIEPDDQKPRYIETVIGEGYVLHVSPFVES